MFAGLTSYWPFGGSAQTKMPTPLPAPRAGRTIRILSLDGGGIRGIIELEFLKKIEKITGKAISELFDMIACTSTGTIIGLALTVPGEDGKARYTAKKVRDVFMAKAKDVFRHSIFGKVEQIFENEYSRSGLNSLGKDFYGNSKMKDSLTEVVVTSYNATEGKPWLFEKHSVVAPAPEDDLEKKHKWDKNVTKIDGSDLQMLDVMEASTAAPTYFPLKKLLINGKEYHFADGGLDANNPALCGLSRAKEIFQDPDFIVCSLGAGITPVTFSKTNTNLGDIQVAGKIIDVLMNAAMAQAREQLEGMFPQTGLDRKFYRFQPVLPEDLSALDDVKNMPRLRQIAKSMIKAVDPQLRELCAKLVSVNAVKSEAIV